MSNNTQELKNTLELEGLNLDTRPSPLPITFSGTMASPIPLTQEETKLAFEGQCKSLDDRLGKKALIRFLNKGKHLKNVLSIYKSDNSNLVTITTRDKNVAMEIMLDLISNYYLHLVQHQDIQFDHVDTAGLPSPLFNYILGAKIPFERNAICGNTADQLKRDVNQLVGDKTHQYQIILPFLEKALSPKLRYYIIQRLKSLTPESFQNMDSLPTLSELFAHLESQPLPPAEELAKCFNEHQEYIWEKDSETGIGFRRLILDDFEFMMKLFRKIFQDSPAFAKMLEESLRTLQPAVVIDASVLYQTLLKMEAQEDANAAYKPSIEFGSPKRLHPGKITLPITLDVPCAQYENSHTVFVIDVSGSMALHQRLEGVKQEMINTVHKLAQRQNQYITIITYSTHATEIINHLKVIPQTIESLSKLINGISVDEKGGTFALTALIKAFEILREGENVNIIFGTDGKFDDAQERAQFSKAVMKIYKSRPKIAPVAVKVFGIDLEEDGEEQIYLKTLSSLAEEGSQLIFSSSKDLGSKLKQLILTERNKMVTQAKVSFQAGNSQSMQVDLRPFASNEPTLRFLDLDEQNLKLLLETAKKMGQTQLTITFDLVFDNQEKTSFKMELSLENIALQSISAPSFMESVHYRNEWIKLALYRCGIERPMALFAKPYSEQLKIMEKIQAEARATQNKEIIERVQSDLQIIVKQWIEEQKLLVSQEAFKLKYSRTNSEQRLKILEAIEKHGAAFSNFIQQDIHSSISQELMLEKIHVHIQKRSCALAGVSSQLMFDKLKSPQEQLEAYVKLKEEVSKQDTHDLKIILPLIDQRIERLWVTGELFKIAHTQTGKLVKTENIFKTLEIEQQYEALDKLRQLAVKEDKSEAVFKQINERMGAIYLETRIRELSKLKSETEMNTAFTHEQRLAIYEKIEQEDETIQYAEVVTLLSARIFDLWLEIQLFKTATARELGIQSQTQFYSQTPEIQLKIVEELNSYAKDFKKDFVHQIATFQKQIQQRGIKEKQKEVVKSIQAAEVTMQGSGGVFSDNSSKPRYISRCKPITGERSLLVNISSAGSSEGQSRSHPGKKEVTPGEQIDHTPVIFSINNKPTDHSAPLPTTIEGEETSNKQKP